jgi:HAMP domain-containing protein
MRITGVALVFLVVYLAVSLAAAYLLGVPQSDLPSVAVLLAGVGAGSGLLALLLSAALGRFGGVRGQLVGAGMVGSLLLAGMVVAGARAMFISGHDLAVLLAMLIFAALLAVGFSLLFAIPMARRIEEVRRGTERLAGGELGAELAVGGNDEVSQVATGFNRMARMLEAAAEREHDMERARRELAASVSHDLRTPLAAVRALIEAVADGVAEDPGTKERYLASGTPRVGRRAFLAGGAGVVLALGSGELFRRLFNQATFSYDGLRAGLEGKLVRAITPNEEFYVVTKNVVDPRVSRAAWRFTINGMVDNPRAYGFEEIAALPGVDQETTLSCISNPVGGRLMSNAMWRGVPLRDLLEDAGRDERGASPGPARLPGPHHRPRPVRREECEVGDERGARGLRRQRLLRDPGLGLQLRAADPLAFRRPQLHPALRGRRYGRALRHRLRRGPRRRARRGLHRRRGDLARSGAHLPG